MERALELGLDHFPELHPNVVAFEERLPNMEGQGAISMAELVRRSLRMNPSRVIVGEVLGDEIVTMLNAMSQGNDGSLSTIHANSSLEVFNRIATYAIQSQERLPVDATHMLIGGAIDFVVFVQKRNEYAQGGRLRRFVSSIREVTGVDGRVLSSEVFAPGPDGRAVPHAPASCICRPGRVRLHGRGALVNSLFAASPLLAVLHRGGWRAARYCCWSSRCAGCPPSRPGSPVRPSWSGRSATSLGPRGALALVAGALVLLVTGWIVGGIGAALLVLGWRSLGGAASERGPSPGWRPWPPGPSRCATPSPAPSASSRRSPRRCAWPRPRCTDRCPRWSTGCTPGCRWPTRYAGSPMTSTIPAPT